MQAEIVKEMLEAQILGMVPEDISVPKSLNLKDAVVHVYPKSKAARAYKEIAAKLLEVEYDSDKDKEKIIEINQLMAVTGRFGVGFYSVLNYLKNPEDYVTVRTSDGKEAYNFTTNFNIFFRRNQDYF